ncbi:T-lymphocyte activation antigen CD86 [Ctenodactylus gundi]
MYNTMGLGIPIFVTALLLSGAASLKIQAYFNETASLPCQFPNSQNRSLSELVIFWQDHENLVLYESYLGNEKSDNVNFKYKGRTSFDQSTWTLHLHHVQITEEGSYQCIVHHRGQQGLFPLHQKAADLSVVVKMSFLLEFENSTSEHNGNMQLSQDNSTGLFNVSISWSIPWSNGTGKATITCALKTTEMSLFSQPLGIGACELLDPAAVPFPPFRPLQLSATSCSPRSPVSPWRGRRRLAGGTFL